MIHVRHAAAAIASGLCETVLITHGESGRSGVGRTRNVVAPTSLAGQFEQPYGPMGPPDFVHDPGIALHDIAVAPAKAGAQSLPLARTGGQATRPPDPGFPLARERRNKLTSNWRGLGRAARVGGEEPARHLQDASASRASRGRLAITWR